MSKPIKIFIAIIGALAILSSAYRAWKGVEFSDYFLGLFIGITLIGSVFFFKGKTAESKHNNN